MKIKKVLVGVILGGLIGTGLYFLNRNWIAPAVAHTADAQGGTYPMAPDFELTDISGQPLDLKAYRGKVVILDFWATWCGPCRYEIPEFINLQKKYRAQGLQVIGVAIEDGLTSVKAYYKQMGMNYPVAVGNGRIAALYGGVVGLPTSFVIGRDGRIYAQHVGAEDESVFENEVRQLLAVGTKSPSSGFRLDGAGIPGNVSGNKIQLGNPKLLNSPVPGIDVSKLTAAQLAEYEKKLGQIKCTCGCDYSVLQCRRVDTSCSLSLQLAEDEYKKLFGSSPASLGNNASRKPEKGQRRSLLKSDSTPANRPAL